MNPAKLYKRMHTNKALVVLCIVFGLYPMFCYSETIIEHVVKDGQYLENGEKKQCTEDVILEKKKMMSGSEYYYCKGFKTTSKNKIDIKECSNGKIANPDFSGCVDDLKGWEAVLPDDYVEDGLASCETTGFLFKYESSEKRYAGCVPCTTSNLRLAIAFAPHDAPNSGEYAYCTGTYHRPAYMKRYEYAGIDFCKDEALKDSNGYHIGCKLNLSFTISDENKTIRCEPGYYLPAGKEKCAQCTLKLLGSLYDIKDLIHMYCPGDTYTKDNYKSQGIKKCPDGQIANEEFSDCVAEKSSKSEEEEKPQKNSKKPTTACDAGKVLSNGKCVDCTSKQDWKDYAQQNRLYCPGGKGLAGKKEKAQFKPCPNGAWPNASLTDCDCKWGKKDGDKCKNTIPANDLKYGPNNGKNTPLAKQCWTKSSADAYRKCMGFGR